MNTKDWSLLAKQGSIHLTQALHQGISKQDFYKFRDQGKLISLSWGVYRSASLPAPSYPDFLLATSRVPAGVICLISALSYYGLTTQIPHAIDLALPKGKRKPTLSEISLTLYHWKEPYFSLGIDSLYIDGVIMKIYDPEKTIVDCFRMRNKIGIDVTVEALTYWYQKRKVYLPKLAQYAKQCRMLRIIEPYLEVLKCQAL